MKILLVGPYPPLQDGVGRYIEQEMLKLQASGNEVEVLSPMPTAAHHYVDLKGGLRLSRLIRIARRYDKVILHYQPSHYHLAAGGISRILTNLGMVIAFSKTPNLTVVAHEVEYPRSQVWWPPHWRIERLAWRNANPQFAFHSNAEAKTLESRFRITVLRKSVREHGSGIRVYCTDSKPEARTKLGLPVEGNLLLCIGFIQPHKGFDRAVRSFARIPSAGSKLAIVGSVRTGTKADEAYARSLHDLAAGDKRVEIREGALTDEEFDRWIIAADVVILPYRELWSSGVAARAKLLGRPMIASPVGGLPEQLGEGDVMVENDEELTEAMARFLGTSTVDVESTAPPGSKDRDTTIRTYEEAVEVLQARIREKSARNGGTRNLDIAYLRGLLEKGLVTSEEIAPSPKPLIGRLLTAVKRAVYRRWMDEPVSEVREQTNALLNYVESIEKERA